MQALQLRPAPRQVLSEKHEVLTEVLHDGVNLALWQRRLAPQVTDFAQVLLAQPLEVSETLQIEIGTDEALRMPPLLAVQADLHGHAAFVADVVWLVEAFACLLDARRVGLRLRSLAKPMCPRFHVDHVPLRLISTYAGVASEWLPEGGMDRRRLGDAQAEPRDAGRIQQMEAGWVALAKGEKWLGNEGAGLIHRSPAPPAGERRLLLTLDWLA
ncbi:DUF1826 domain-containing protein [Pseudomonas sp. BMS12]|uniref:DUF1826 domain-containing protein n=1 Tax=Pseudomonas sp. BMS12 TaxID=1796033 RepID=UPI00083B511F|nr:DUF1826 domain-containing protein [Pseudomonas sp. BMS12]